MALARLKARFSKLKDPRVERTKLHQLIDIVIIAFLAVLCGAEGWEDMEAFGQAKETWLKEQVGLELANGIPSEDTFRRVFNRLDPEAFGQCLVAWLRELCGLAEGEVIALDGKTLRHSFDTATGQAAIHLVSAWATEQGLTLGQVKVDEKSNEITALPGLLRLLDLAGCIVTTDAMGGQKEVARQIIDQQGDDVLALKENHPTLDADVPLFFEDARAQAFYEQDPQERIADDYHETVDPDHGRIERRRHWMIADEEIAWLDQKEAWKGLRSLGMVERERHIGGKVTVEVGFFVSSLGGNARQFARVVRNHWRIENSLPYVLDVSLNEDACGVWQEHGAENLGMLRRVAVSLLKQERTSKQGIKARRKRAGWDNEYLLRVLTAGV